MMAITTNCADEVDKIASSLADKYLKQIYDLYNEKSYSAYIKSMSVILHWSHEFYKQYYYKLNDWLSFEGSKDNKYKAINREVFLIAWGKDRMKQFSFTVSDPGNQPAVSERLDHSYKNVEIMKD